MKDLAWKSTAREYATKVHATADDFCAELYGRNVLRQRAVAICGKQSRVPLGAIAIGSSLHK